MAPADQQFGGVEPAAQTGGRLRADLGDLIATIAGAGGHGARNGVGGRDAAFGEFFHARLEQRAEGRFEPPIDGKRAIAARQRRLQEIGAIAGGPPGGDVVGKLRHGRQKLDQHQDFVVDIEEIVGEAGGRIDQRHGAAFQRVRHGAPVIGVMILAQ